MKSWLPIFGVLAVSGAAAASETPSLAAATRSQTLYFVRGFQFVGNTTFSAQELTSVLADYQRKGLDARRLPELAARVSEVYRARGQTVQVSIPEHEVRAGILTVRITEPLPAAPANLETRRADRRTLDLWSSYSPTGFVKLGLMVDGWELGPGRLSAAAVEAAGAVVTTPPVVEPSWDSKAVKTAALPGVAAPAPQRTPIREVHFEGNSAVTDEALTAVVDVEPEKPVSLSDLKSMASRVAEHYHNLGYFLAQAVVPQQDVKDGAVTLRILEGRLGEVEVTGTQRCRESFVRQALSQLQPGEPLQLQALERALLVLNEASGIRATSLLRAGKEVGTTDLVLQVVEQNLPTGSWEANNFGTRLSSRYRIAPSVVFPNVSGRGDAAALQLTSGLNPSDVFFADLSYVTPVAPDGTKVSAHVGGGRFEIGEEFSALGIEGRGFSWGLGASRPLERTRTKSVTVEAGLEVNDSEQTLLGATTSDDRIRKLRVGVSLDEKDGAGRNLLRVGVQQGLGSFLGGMPDSSPLSSRSFSFADGTFTKLTADYTRFQRINQRTFVIGRLVGQYSTSPLVVGEQFSIGGANSVRGHPQSSYLGDDGFMLSLEARVSPLPADHEYYDDFQLALFADTGTVNTKRPGVGQQSTRTISGIGFGVRANLPDDLSIRADLGFALGRQPLSGGTAVPYLQVNRHF